MRQLQPVASTLRRRQPSLAAALLLSLAAASTPASAQQLPAADGNAELSAFSIAAPGWSWAWLRSWFSVSLDAKRRGDDEGGSVDPETGDPKR